MHIAAFPKCYLDAICVDRTMDVFQWIDMADALEVEGLELYEGFFASLDRGYLESIGDALARGQPRDAHAVRIGGFHASRSNMPDPGRSNTSCG